MAHRALASLRSQWMGALALFLLIAGGTAYAANTVGSADIINESIQSQDIKNGQVKGPDIGNNQVGTADVRDDGLANGGLSADDLAIDSVGATEVADDSLDTGEIIDNSLFSEDLGPNSVGGSELADGSVTSADVASNTLTAADIAGADVSGHVSFSGVANGRCTQATLGVSGAAVGQVPLVATGGALQNGIVLYAQRVESAGHIEADICNFSGAAMDPINDLAVRVITFG